VVSRSGQGRVVAVAATQRTLDARELLIEEIVSVELVVALRHAVAVRIVAHDLGVPGAQFRVSC
jgi:hypothetical protein